AGCSLGFVQKKVVNGENLVFFQLNLEDSNGQQPKFQCKNDEIQIFLKQGIDLKVFFILLQISLISVKGDQIFINPSIKMIGKMYEQLAEHDCVKELQLNLPPIKEAFETVKQRQGKLTLHTSLALLRVKSPDLQAIIKTFFN